MLVIPLIAHLPRAVNQPTSVQALGCIPWSPSPPSLSSQHSTKWCEQHGQLIPLNSFYPLCPLLSIVPSLQFLEFRIPTVDIPEFNSSPSVLALFLPSPDCL